MPDDGYSFSGWFAYEKDYILDKKRNQKVIKIKVEEDLCLRANFLDDAKKTGDNINISEDKKYIIGSSKGEAVVISTNKIDEVNSFEIERQLDDLGWYDNSSFIMFSNNNVILQELTGDRRVIHENINYTATNNIFKDHLERKIITKYEHNKLYEDRYVGNLKISIYDLNDQLADFSIDYAADGPFYSKPVISNEQRYVAIRGLKLYVFDIENNEKIVETNAMEPLYWRDIIIL